MQGVWSISFSEDAGFIVSAAFEPHPLIWSLSNGLKPQRLLGVPCHSNPTSSSPLKGARIHSPRHLTQTFVAPTLVVWWISKSFVMSPKLCPQTATAWSKCGTCERGIVFSSRFFSPLFPLSPAYRKPPFLFTPPTPFPFRHSLLCLWVDPQSKHAMHSVLEHSRSP